MCNVSVRVPFTSFPFWVMARMAVPAYVQLGGPVSCIVIDPDHVPATFDWACTMEICTKSAENASMMKNRMPNKEITCFGENIAHKIFCFLPVFFRVL